MNVLIDLFQWYEIADNIAKARTITFQPGALRSGMSEEAKGLK